jgi:RNA polymerase sigma-70 factor (ECF subfamily)
MRRFLNRLEANAGADHTARPGAAANREAIAAMQRYCEGDAAAFPVLYAIAAPRLFMFMRCLVRDHALAEELLQQTFLKLHQVRASYVAGAAPLPWLYAIAHRTCLDALRRRLRAPVVAADKLGELPARIDGGCETARPTYGEYTIDAVLCALDRLPETLRSAVVLTKIEGNSIKETAAILGTTPSAVKLRAHRGYVKLRELLREHDAA